MKAKEYFDKYFGNVKSEQEMIENAKSMYADFFKEFEAIKEKRKIKTMDGLVGIIRELNDKWNSIATKVEAKFSAQFLKRNAIWNNWLYERWGDEFPRKPDGEERSEGK